MVTIKGKIEAIYFPRKEKFSFLSNKETAYFTFCLYYKNEYNTNSRVICKGVSYKIFVNEYVSLSGEYRLDKGQTVFYFSKLQLDFKKNSNKKPFLEHVIGKDFYKQIYTKYKEVKKILDKKELENVASKDIFLALNNKDVSFFETYTSANKRLIETFFKSYQTNKIFEEVYDSLSKLGVSDYIIKKILDTTNQETPEDIIAEVKKNPFALISKGLAFKTCDDIFYYNGGEYNAPIRIAYCCLQALKMGYESGNCYLKKDEYIKTIFDVLKYSRFEKTELDVKTIEKYIERLIEKKRIVAKDDRYYLEEYFEEEENLRNFCKYALNAPQEKNNVKDFIKKYESEHNITLGREQKLAVEKSCNSLISVITGGAGVGKTSSLACIISYLLEVKKYDINDIALCAPTGKASQRMQESIFKQTNRKFKATTIHVLLEVNPVDEKLETFRFNKDNKLNKKCIVIDETSMLNYRVANALISAIKLGTKVIFLGDIEQLEPIGAGYFFRDLIESKVPTTYLKEIHRQKGNSTIIPLSIAIRDENLFEKDIEKQDDFLFIDMPKTLPFEEQLDAIAHIFMVSVKKSSLEDTMIITPYRETEKNDAMDSKTLSVYIQDILLPDKEGELIIQKNGYKFKIGSKVIQTRNNNAKDKGLINGQIGYITDINVEESLVCVDFEGKEVWLSPKDLDDLRLAYAITVHKSQGSDWKNVIYCCFTKIGKDGREQNMNNKNLVYTAVTRAKTNLVVVGYKKIFLDSYKSKTKRKNSVLLNKEFAN